MLETLVDAANDAMFAMDAQGRIVLWNRDAERLCGYAADDVLGGPLPVLFPSDLRESSATLVDAVLAGDRRRPVGDDVRASHRDAGLGVARRCTRSSTSTAARAARWRSRSTPPSNGSPRSCWPRPRRGCRRARRWRTSGRWLWDVAHRHRAVEREFHRIHGVDPLEFEGTIEAHLGRIVPRNGRRCGTRSNAPSPPVVPSTSTTRSSAPTAPAAILSTRAEPAIGASGEVVGLRGIGRDVTDA